MPRSSYGGRHELGQNFLTHRPTIERIVDLVARTDGAITEIGAGDGALTRRLATLGRPLIAIDIDERRVKRLQRALAHVRVVHADAMRFPLDRPVIVGNVPFHLTTPILRRLLRASGWRSAILLTQWEVARKRAGVGGGTLLTAQAAPWFTFALHDRVAARSFTPSPGVDGGVLAITRRDAPLVPLAERARYERFVARVFTGGGSSLARIVGAATSLSGAQARRALLRAGIAGSALARDVTAPQWAELWSATTRRR